MRGRGSGLGGLDGEADVFVVDCGLGIWVLGDTFILQIAKNLSGNNGWRELAIVS